VEEQRADTELEEDTIEGEETTDEEMTAVSSVQLSPTEIRDYVRSLKESSVHWFNSFYPDLAEGMFPNERKWVDRLNRVGITYFRPLVMAILKSCKNVQERIQVFKQIERFIFIVFRMTQTRANYRSSEFYRAARAVDAGKMDLEEIEERLQNRMSFTFDDDGKLKNGEFYVLLEKRFNSGSGYYGWPGLRYFLHEYELSLLNQSRQKKVHWSDLLKTKKDCISIEHIYPQTESGYWAQMFEGFEKEMKTSYCGSLGNLLLLSSSINSSLQNDSFPDKRSLKKDAEGNTIRNGYCDGSHSEIEVSQLEKDPQADKGDQVKTRAHR